MRIFGLFHSPGPLEVVEQSLSSPAFAPRRVEPMCAGEKACDGRVLSGSIASFHLRLLRFSLVLFLLVAFVGVAGAEEKGADAAVIYPRMAESKTDAVAGRGPGYSGILVAALLLAAAGGWLFWKGRGAPGASHHAKKLAIAETRSLGNRQYLVVATYEDKKFLLSVCPGRIDLLTHLDATPPAPRP